MTFIKPLSAMSAAEAEIPKVLVVNDDPASLMAMVGLLDAWAEELGCEIISAKSGEDALRQVLQHDFAVMLLDVNMPGMDGFETAQAIHLRARSASTPVIFVTAYHADEMDRLKGYQAGAVDYLFTPIIPQVLKAKLSVFVSLARNNMELRRQAFMLDRRGNELAAINAQLEQEIYERQAAERESRAKDEFLAMLGHELRNPLGAISSAVAILDQAGNQNIEMAKGVLRRQSLHLRRIVDDLLDLSRMMSGKIALDRRPVDCAKLIETCVETLKITGRAEQYQLVLRAEPVWASADPARLEQVVTNLLDNAVKYTQPGGTIHIDVMPEDSAVVIAVRDSGIGIKPELLPHIFDVFVQGERTLDRSQGGLGIGLALARQLVLLHGGTIAADSTGHGNGSAFTVRLPRLTQSDIDPAPNAIPASGNHCRVLLIEDNDDGREMMAMVLTAYGNTVLTAADGVEGLRIAAEQMPDIALVDIGLPGLDGYEIARRIRLSPDIRHIKLIALTGYGLEEDRRRAIDVGFDLHLVKPVDADHLLEAIKNCMPAAAAKNLV